MILKLERRCDLLSEMVQRNDKGTSSLVDNLLQKTASPFTNEVANFLIPEKFKVSDILIYTGLEDPMEHLENFRAHTDLHRTPDGVACQAFPLTLSSNARD